MKTSSGTRIILLKLLKAFQEERTVVTNCLNNPYEVKRQKEDQGEVQIVEQSTQMKHSFYFFKLS